MGNKILEIKNISKSFGGVKALQNVSFSCNAGEVHVIMGENGAGKSTLLKILSGLFKADSGEIYLNGKLLDFKSPRDAQKMGIAMVYQELTVLPDLTVGQNIFLNDEPLMSLGTIDRKKIKLQTVEIAKKYNIDINPDDYVGDLPIAERQMVEILKILVRDPDIVIFDEPTSSLAGEEVEKLYKIIRILVERNKTVIFISHRLEEIIHIGDRATVLKDGQFIDTVNIKDISQEDIVKLMIGRSLQSLFPPKEENSSGDVIFEVKDLNIAKTIHDISFCVKKKEIIGIAGLQGHGQTQLLNAIAGILPVNSGKIYLDSKNIHIRNPRDAINAGIVLIPEDRKTLGLLLTLSIKDNIASSSLHFRSKLGFIKRKEESALVKDIINKLSIKTPGSEQRVINLSGGNQQKVVLGKGFAVKPKVILFNEPTRGVDVGTKQEIYRIIREMADSGMTVILYSSDLMEVIGISDRVLVMYEGHIKAEINGKEITEENIMRAAVGIG